MGVIGHAAVSVFASPPVSALLIVGAASPRWIKTCYCEASHTVKPLPPVVIRDRPMLAQSRKPSFLRDMWSLIKPDIVLMCSIIVTAIAAAFLHLQAPIVTGELINVISSGLRSSFALAQLNRPAIKLFALLAAQGKREERA